MIVWWRFHVKVCDMLFSGIISLVLILHAYLAYRMEQEQKALDLTLQILQVKIFSFFSNAVICHDSAKCPLTAVSPVLHLEELQVSLAGPNAIYLSKLSNFDLRD